MLRTLLISFATISAIACAGASADTRVRKAPAEALRMKSVDWKRDTTPTLWPTTVKHVQVISVNGRGPGERFVFVVADGARLLAVYRASGEEATDLHNRIAGAARATINSPTVDYSNGGQGLVIGPPPPPPPGPQGFPERIVNAIMNHAYNMNEQTTLLERELSAPAR